MKKYDLLIQRVLTLAKELGVYLIVRIQNTKSKHIVVNNGKTEEMYYNEGGGISFQAFTKAGGCGFATSEKIDEDSSLKMVKIATEIAEEMEKRGGKPNTEIFQQEPVVESRYSNTKYPFDYLTLEEEERLLVEFNREILNSYGNVAIESLYRNVMDHWRIVRSDGTDVYYEIPRTIVANTITAKGNRTASTRGALSGSDISILLDEEKKQKLYKRIQQSCNLAVALLSAPKIKSGNYKIVLDYALAKGLAHEAFGHAAESDGMKLSILADEKGHFREGELVASPSVSIIDESIEGDYAYQPYSANGSKRERTEIIKGGILKEALADIFSAKEAGVQVTGAGRVESYRHLPLPRMSNIRIEVEGAIPLDKDFEDVTPQELYQILLKNNYIKPEEEVLYLVGYKGGQVKSSQGEFVFNCSGIYRLGEECTLYQPAIFSGKVLSALKSIKAGVGPLLLDAQGSCGKAGQNVPSSGGSHYFILLESNKDVIIGGE
ncbi:TldD/PmbA family protein [Alkaliphilus transvaalensis]|uniref:TldD/PmbA family protein n=1 Tax=Alkaliphilus transvaalensis TaxID=114628 RepID=UPI00047BD771|nr:TldD/PmbA family protein [Alkaliphilus transvaalensis]